MTGRPSAGVGISADDLDRIRAAEFASLRDAVYLNHASLGPLPSRTLAAVRAFDEDRARRGSACIDDHRDVVPTTRHALATLIGADDEEVAFIPTTPAGISIVASGLPWRSGDNVVTTGLEFPANVYPWLNLAARGVATRIVPPRDETLWIEDILAQVDDRTRVVAVSWVTFSTGQRLDLAALGAHCRDRGVRLVVDAIQGLGYLPLDVHAAKVDYLAAAAHKWLLSPYGAGCLFVRAGLLDELVLTQVGQNSVVPSDSYLEYDFVPKASAARFEPGVPNFGAIAGLEASLGLILEVGVDTMWTQVTACARHLRSGLLERGFRVLGPADGEATSGVVSFVAPTGEVTRRAFERLTDARVVISLREGAVRVAPHFYNSTDDIESLLDALGDGVPPAHASRRSE